MSFRYPAVVIVALLVAAGLAAGYGWLQRRRSRLLAEAGMRVPDTTLARVRRHLPPVVFLTAVTLLLVAAGRPQATVAIPRTAGTVVLTFDVSNSMAAADVAPTRLAAAQAAAVHFVESQPDTVDIGVVAFSQGAMTTLVPTEQHEDAIAAINRLTIAGGTSLGQAILASLTTIVGKPVSLPREDLVPPDLGYWGSATIVLLSDGEDTGGPDAVAAAELTAAAGIHIETVGVGTAGGATIEVDGYQVATALNEELLAEIAATTNGAYHPAADAQALDAVYDSLDLRITIEEKLREVTAIVVWIALLLLVAGGASMIIWYGRMV